MAYRTLEITLQSAKDLKDVHLFSRMEVYAVASITGDPPSRQQTPPDRDGGRNPSWNYTMKFYIPADVSTNQNSALHILLRARRALGDRDVGEVYVPLRDLLAGVTGDGSSPMKFLSYQVRHLASGKPKGVLNFSYKLGERINAPANAAAGSSASGVGYPPPSKHDNKPNKMNEPVTAYPAGYPPQGYGGQQQAHPYPAYPPQGYGYQQPPPAGYGYPPSQGYGYGMAAPPRRNNFGMGLGTGLLGGALGGMLLGDMMSDASAYNSGYDNGMYDGGYDGGGYDGGFDGGGFDDGGFGDF